MVENKSEAPCIQLTDRIKEEISKESKLLLEKYFEGRDYDKNKVNLWKEYTLKELSDFLSNNYKQYGFLVLIIVIKKGEIRINSRVIYRKDTDSYLYETLENKSMFIEIKIVYFKLFNSKINLKEFINDALVLKMNDILIKNLEGKKYSYEFAMDKANAMVIELQKELLNVETKPCSFQIDYILSKPIEYQFSYKVLNLDYLPLIATYSNDSLYAQLILFIFNN